MALTSLCYIGNPSFPGQPMLALAGSEGTLPADVKADGVIATGWETPEGKDVCFMFEGDGAYPTVGCI